MMLQFGRLIVLTILLSSQGYKKKLDQAIFLIPKLGDLRKPSIASHQNLVCTLSIQKLKRYISFDQLQVTLRSTLSRPLLSPINPLTPALDPPPNPDKTQQSNHIAKAREKCSSPILSLCLVIHGIQQQEY